MNLGVITTPNTKGQIVIPKKYRDTLRISENTPLQITLHKDGVLVSPISKVIKISLANKNFLRVLNETRGAWAGDNWPETEKRQRKIELAATRRNKKAW